MFARTTDPGESYNLSQNMPEKVSEMEAIIKRWEKAMAANPVGIIK